jgi:hypothetical protein
VRRLWPVSGPPITTIVNSESVPLCSTLFSLVQIGSPRLSCRATTVARECPAPPSSHHHHCQQRISSTLFSLVLICSILFYLFLACSTRLSSHVRCPITSTVKLRICSNSLFARILSTFELCSFGPVVILAPSPFEIVCLFLLLSLLAHSVRLQLLLQTRTIQG